MDGTVAEVVQSCTAASDAESVSFGEVVMRLQQAGVERYHADLLRSEKTYYLPTGDSLVVPCASVDGLAPPDFSPASVGAAVRAVQGKAIGYRAFCERILAAGCVGYHVSLAGRRAVYYGRCGESHVEPFPGAR